MSGTAVYKSSRASQLQQANQHITKSIVCGRLNICTTVHALLDRPADHITQLSDLLSTSPAAAPNITGHSTPIAQTAAQHGIHYGSRSAQRHSLLTQDGPTLQGEPEVEEEGVRCAVRQALRQRQRMAVARAQPRARPRPRQLRQHRHRLPAACTGSVSQHRTPLTRALSAVPQVSSRTAAGCRVSTASELNTTAA